MSYIPPETQSSILTSFTSWPSLFTLALAIAFAVHKLLLHLDYPILSIFELAWNALVYFMPAQVVYALDSKFGKAFARKGNAQDSIFDKHAEKSEVLRTVFGLDGTKPSADDAESIPGPRGLGNWDNSCFQNSVLQALSSLSDFRTFLDRFAESDQLEDSSLSALLELTRNLNDRSESCKHMWIPAKLKSMNSWQQQDAQEYFSKVMDQLENDVKKLWHEEPAPSDPGLSLLPKHSVDHKPPHSLPSKHNTVDNPVDGLLAQRVGCLQCGYAEGISLIPFNCLTLPLGKNPTYDIRDCLDSYTDLELIEGVECGKCTLVRAAKQLQQLLSALPNTTSLPSPDDSVISDTKRTAYNARLQAVTSALETSSFSDATLSKACQIPPKLRVTSTKTRQAVVMRQPKCLVLHVNRSMFDEHTGDLLKNYAKVSFPAQFDLSEWCGGNSNTTSDEPRKDEDEESKQHDIELETWQMDPSKSMLSTATSTHNSPYRLQALITHQGRHENGHYICYRKLPRASSHTSSGQQEQWWRLSDEQVWEVSEEEVLAQGGVFMLFYERSGTREREVRAEEEGGRGKEEAEELVRRDSGTGTEKEEDVKDCNTVLEQVDASADKKAAIKEVSVDEDEISTSLADLVIEVASRDTQSRVYDETALV